MTDGQMRCIQVARPESQPFIAHVPRPQPQSDEVLVRVRACGLNFADLLMMKGSYQDMPPFPLTPGLEVAGDVVATGPQVTQFALGDRVAAFPAHGGLAEFVTCPATRCIAIPARMGWVEAAGFIIAYGSSHLALAHRARLQPGERLVVLGAAGGVGLTAVEIGARMGAEVIAVARGQAKLEVARAAGAHLGLDSDTTDLRAALKEMGGVDVIYDAVGEPMASQALRALRPEGRFLAIGFAGGEVPQFPANLLLVKNIDVIGFYWGGYMKFAPARLAASLRTLLDWHEAEKLHPHVSMTVPFEDVAHGFDAMRARRSTGKIVVTI